MIPTVIQKTNLDGLTLKTQVRRQAAYLRVPKKPINCKKSKVKVSILCRVSLRTLPATGQAPPHPSSIHAGSGTVSSRIGVPPRTMLPKPPGNPAGATAPSSQGPPPRPNNIQTSRSGGGSLPQAKRFEYHQKNGLPDPTSPTEIAMLDDDQW